MNILYLNKSMHLGGDNKCILKLCVELKDKYNIFIASSGGILEEEFDKMAIKHYKIDNAINKMPHMIIQNVIKLAHIVKKEKIQVIHSHHRMTTLTARIVSKITGVKVIHTQHSCIKDKIKLTKIALKDTEIIAVSNAVKRILEEKYNLDNKHIRTIYNTIDTKEHNEEVDDILIQLKNKGYFIISQVGRVVKNKGIDDFLVIAREVVKENNKIKFVLIGDGPIFDEVHKKIINNKLEEDVFLLGNKSNIIDHLKYIDLMLLCSYVEGLPLAPIEAFSQSIPVIATDIDGTNEEIINGHNGYLVEVGNIKLFKERILEIYKDDSLLNKMKQNSYHMYIQHFNNNQYIENHKQVYDEIIKEDING
ncbi:MAG: glycosyltransferase family 4 protein [Paraclostridium sordellii]